MTDLTDEAVKSLLDGATPGPWAYEPHGDTGDYGVGVCYAMSDIELAFPLSGQVDSDVMVYDPICPEVAGQGNAAIMAAAPVLARAILDARAELAQARADAQAAQVMVAERDALKKKLISPDPYEDTAHPDDHAVNRFAAVMKGKLASKRLQGRGGWQAPEVPNGYLSRLLREHVDKGDPVDVANFAMMIHQRGERIAPENEGASCKAIDKAETERDRLAAAIATQEAGNG